ncbi:MAG: dimethylargininase [Micromonosporaceae bacterium]
MTGDTPLSEPGRALVRAPSSRLAEGLVTHIQRTPIDLDLARSQHHAYVRAIQNAGWDIVHAGPADDCPDSVFVEDVAVICGSLAVLTRPGAPERQPETPGVAQAIQQLGLPVASIQAPGTLDGGDVLQHDRAVYVGLGGRTNAGGVKQLQQLLAGQGREVIPVPLGNVLHLKSVVTKLPDGSLLAWPGLADLSVLPPYRVAEERAGCHFVLLGGDQVLMAASAPRTAAMLEREGLTPILVDISEFEKLEASVTCLSVLIPAAP